jgi:hypothetical protein
MSDLDHVDCQIKKTSGLNAFRVPCISSRYKGRHLVVLIQHGSKDNTRKLRMQQWTSIFYRERYSAPLMSVYSDDNKYGTVKSQTPCSQE